MDRALAEMSRTFKAAYSGVGRPGVPPETLLKALLLQCLYTIRQCFEIAAAAYNLVRMKNLLAG